MKRVPLLILLLATFVALSPPAQAEQFKLTESNSMAWVDPSSQAGMFKWTVDDASILYQQWFWYRVGDTAEQSIDTLPLTSATQPSPDTLHLIYTAPEFTLQINYGLLGGSPGSYVADISESIKIVNTSSRDLDFHFFQYSDFDLANDRVDFLRIDPTLHYVTQWPIDAGVVLSETSVTSVASPPNHAEAGVYPDTLGRLNDGSPTTLNDHLTAGAGDVTWAFEWDKVIHPRGTLSISKDKNLGPVPEPAAIGLFGGVLLLVASKLRKKIA